MKCPICKSKMIITGKARLESVAEHVFQEHVSMKDVYGCSNKKCIAYREKLRWDWYGAFYGSSIIDLRIKKSMRDYPFIDGNCGPFGSQERRIIVEIYKKDKDVDFLVVDLSLFGLPIWRFELQWEYEADMNGNILKRRPKFNAWKDGVLYLSGIHMFLFCIKTTRYHYKKMLECPTKYWISEFLNCFEIPDWDKRWWKHLAVKILKWIYNPQYLKDGLVKGERS